MNCAIHDILFWNNNIHFVFFFLFSSMPLSRNCSAVKIARFWNTKQNCGNSGDNQLWHRGCCHNINNANSDYLTPSKKAIEAGIKMLGMDEIVPKAKPISHLLKKYRTAKMEETKHQNNLFDTGELCLMLCPTNLAYW